MWEEWTEGIYPNYRGLAEETRRADSVKLHSHISALISSQAFAFNLFLPFREGKRGRLSERIGEMVGARLTIDKVRFEFVPPVSCCVNWVAHTPPPNPLRWLT